MNTTTVTALERADTKDCPKEATHVKMNPTGEFIEMFYRRNENGLWQYLSSCGGGWMYSDAQEKDKNFSDRLILIKAQPTH